MAAVPPGRKLKAAAVAVDAAVGATVAAADGGAAVAAAAVGPSVQEGSHYPGHWQWWGPRCCCCCQSWLSCRAARVCP